MDYGKGKQAQSIVEQVRSSLIPYVVSFLHQPIRNNILDEFPLCRNQFAAAPGRGTKLASLSLRLAFDVSLVRSWLLAMLFVDVATAYYSLIRRLAVSIPKDGFDLLWSC